MTDELVQIGRGQTPVRLASLRKELEKNKPFSTYIYAGQSNCQGQGEIPPTPDQFEPTPGMYMLDEEGEITPARFPFFRTPTDGINTGHTMSPAWIHAQQRAARGEKVLMVGAAVNGSGLIADANKSWFGPTFATQTAPPASVIWKDVPNQFGINGNFTNRYEDGLTMAMVGNYRYACEKARIDTTGVSSGSLTFDSEQWPTVTSSGAEAQPMDLLLFVDMGYESPIGPQYNQYIDGSGNLTGFDNVYRTGRYWVEIETDDQAADAHFSIAGDGGSLVRTQDQTPTQPAIYRFDVTTRTRTGLRLRITAPIGASVKLTDIAIYHEDERLQGVQKTLVWREDFITFHSRFNRYRDMEARHENELGALISNLAQEPKLSWATFDGVGPPAEFTAEFCNLCSLDYQPVIPASACLNTAYLDDRALTIKTVLNDYLRVLPHTSNEIWHGNGISDGLNPAIVFQQTHAVNLGYVTAIDAADSSKSDTNFAARMKAQAYATGLMIERFQAVFADQPDRFVAICESQNGNTGAQNQLLDFQYNGAALGTMLQEFQVAPYLWPNGTDTVNWFLFDPADSQVDRQAFYDNECLPKYQASMDSALAGLQTTKNNLDAKYPSVQLSTYESSFQDGLSFGVFPAWTTSTVCTFDGFGVLQTASGASFPTLHQSKFNHVYIDGNNPYGQQLMTDSSLGFVESEWINTGQLPASEYTDDEKGRSLIGMMTLKSLPEFKAMIKDGWGQIHSITGGGCNTIYKSTSNPDLQGGWRGFGTYTGEPYSQSIDVTFTGPWAPNTALIEMSLRPNGETPVINTGEEVDENDILEPGGQYYQSVVDRVNAAIGKGYKLILRGAFWAQGEADGNQGVATLSYEGALENMLKGWAVEIDDDFFGGRQDIFAVLTGMSQSHMTFGWNGNPASQYIAIDEAIRNVAQKRRRSAYVGTSGLVMVNGDGPNGLHYDDASIRELGKRWDIAQDMAEQNMSGAERAPVTPMDDFDATNRYPRGEVVRRDLKLIRSIRATGPGFVDSDWEDFIVPGDTGGTDPGNVNFTEEFNPTEFAIYRVGNDVLGPAANVIGTKGVLTRLTLPSGLEASGGQVVDEQGALGGINLVTDLQDLISFLKVHTGTQHAVITARGDAAGSIYSEMKHINTALGTIRSRGMVGNLLASYGIEVIKSDNITWLVYGLDVSPTSSTVRGKNEATLEVDNNQNDLETAKVRLVRNGANFYELVFEVTDSAGVTREVIRFGQDNDGGDPALPTNTFWRVLTQDGTYSKVIVSDADQVQVFAN